VAVTQADIKQAVELKSHNNQVIRRSYS